MRIKYFAWIKDITKKEEEELNSHHITNLQKLKDFITTEYPSLKKHLDKEILRFAVNQEYVFENPLAMIVRLSIPGKDAIE